MQTTRLVGLVCLVAAFFVASGLSVTTAAVDHKGRPLQPNVVAVVPSPSPTPSCDKQQMTIGEVTLCSSEFNFNFKTGDLQFPQEIHGRSSDGTYRADRGYGNLHSQVMNLIGHVVVHRDATHDKAGKPVAAMTLTADQVHIESKAKFYRASGNVKIVQADMTLTAPLITDDEGHKMINASGGVKIVKGDKTMTAPQIALNETTHVADLTGGVHAEQKPDRSFDAAEVLYNTVSEDFKALGGVRMRFPASAPKPTASPSNAPSPSPSPTK